jgi:hypothetical protein
MASAPDQHETNGRPDPPRRPQLVAVGVIVVRSGEVQDIFPEGSRYRTIFVRVDWAGGEPAVREPDACAQWSWFRWDDPPEPLFLPVASLRATEFRP